MVNASDEIKRLARSLEAINKHNLLRTYDSTWNILWYNFIRGLAFGLGTVIGATILVYVLLQFLAQIEFIPILGDWALKFISEIEKGR